MEPLINSQSEKNEIKLNFKESKYATGKRKKSIARVWLKKGTGNININGKKMIDYFTKINLQTAINRPLALVKKINEFEKTTKETCAARGYNTGSVNWKC